LAKGCRGGTRQQGHLTSRKLQPKKPKNVRTDNANVRLVRERISNSQKAKQERRGGGPGAGANGDDLGMDGVTLVNSLQVLEQEEEQRRRGWLGGLDGPAAPAWQTERFVPRSAMTTRKLTPYQSQPSSKRRRGTRLCRRPLPVTTWRDVDSK